MSEKEDAYVPTPEDRAIMASLSSGLVISKIQQFYTAGKYSLETYNRLFDVARTADTEVKILLDMLKQEVK